MIATAPIAVTPALADAGAVYRAFWRWHFYAGLLVMPVLMLMALTGGLYLFRQEIDALVYRPLLTVEARADRAAPDAWVAAATDVSPGRVAQLVLPQRSTESVRVVIEAADGERRAAFVDPHDATVLGVTPEDGVMDWVKRVHSLDVGWPVLNLLVELVAGWAIVMVATGVVLWWPRGQAGGVVSVRGSPARRVFWRDLHAVAGVVVGALIVFLAATGMPWSAFWGEQVNALTSKAGWGRPPPPVAGASFSHDAHAGHDAVPWTLQSTALHTAPAAAAPASVTALVAAADAANLPRPYRLTLPSAPGKAVTAAYWPEQAERTRTLYLDPQNARVLADIGWDRFGPAARAVEWGIAVHQGTQYGPLNRWLMLAACISIWLLGVSALIMWWKRRPPGRLAAPAAPADRRAYRPLALVVVPLGLLYPLVGVSLLLVLMLDLAFRRFGLARRPALEPR